MFTDVQLKVGRTLFPAHRMALAADNDYFYAMFTNGMKETIQEILNKEMKACPQKRLNK